MKLSEDKKLRSLGKKKTKTNFMDKVVAPIQRRGGTGNITTIGMAESHVFGKDEIKTYGSLGLDKDSLPVFSADDYIKKMETELENETLDEEVKSIKTGKLLFVTNIRNSLRNFSVQQFKVQEIGDELVLVFDFIDQKKYPFILQFFIKYIDDGSIFLEGLYKKIQPFKVSIRAFENEDGETISKTDEDIGSLYLIHSGEELLVKALYQNSRINHKMIALSANLELIMINRKYFVATFIDASNLALVVELLGEMYNEFVNHKTGLKSVTYIKCFSCEADLDENDETCPNCGGNRPRCAICMLDLQPAEQEEVVQLPCCGVYGHREHILMWVEKAHSCPNCRSKQVEWVDELKMSS